MRIRFIPVKPFGFHAITFYPWVFVWKGAKLDAGLMVHEQVHLDEQKRDGRWAWWWRYLTKKSFRIQAEVRAYRKQIYSGGLSPTLAAVWLCKYDSQLSLDDALQLLIP